MNDTQYGGLIDKYFYVKILLLSLFIILTIILTGCGFNNDYTIFTNVSYSVCQVSCADLGQSHRCSSQSMSYNTDSMVCECVIFECLQKCNECMK